MNISGLNKEKKDFYLAASTLATGVSSLFLFACICSILSMGTWAWVQAGEFYFMSCGGLTFWDAHEMLLGSVAAIILGFLLAAEQSWTGLRAAYGKKLMVLFTLCLLARIFTLIDVFAFKWLNALIDIIFFF